MVTYVIGHKNPDADSICSAIAYAEFKRKLGFKNIKAARAGEINEQTKFILNYFKQKEPVYLKDSYRRAKDIMTTKVFFVRENDSLKKAIDLINKYNIRFLPVISNKNTKEIVGILTLLDIAKYFVKKIAENKIGKIIDAKVINICDEADVCLEDESIKDLEEKIIKSKSKGLIVINEKNEFRGIITKTNLIEPSKTQFILVDHNELAQALDGIEEAEIIEVIDHHRLAPFHTLYPITFINEPVGSTSTIVAGLYKKSKLNPTKTIAGLLLSGILSDTLCLKSSTTTNKDKEMAKWLSKICKIKINFIERKFNEISIVKKSTIFEKSPAEIIKEDFKIYSPKNKKIGLGQVEIFDFNKFYENMDKIKEELDRIKEKEDFNFVGMIITNVSKGDSLLLCVGDKDIVDRIPWPKLQSNLYELKGIVSRKKQIAPTLLQIIEFEKKRDIIEEYEHYIKK